MRKTSRARTRRNNKKKTNGADEAQVRVRVPPEDFVRAWQAATSLAEVGEALGLTRSAVCGRAAHYRKKGVPLKRMPAAGRRSCDWEGLAGLAEELAAEE